MSMFCQRCAIFFLVKERRREREKKKKERMRWMSPSSYINNGHMDESSSFPSLSCHQGVEKYHQVRTCILLSSNERGREEIVLFEGKEKNN